MTQEKVIGRLAPSPTGSLHLGHALSFLAAWWHARSQNGQIVLRLEDLDNARVRQEHIEATLFDLKWLGLDWDGEPLLQSQRRPPLLRAAHQLLNDGHAYPCSCTRSQLAQHDPAQHAPQQGVPEPRYPGTCKSLYSDIEMAEKLSGQAAGLRLIVPPETVQFTDMVYGEYRANIAKSVGDFLILRRNKTPAYQLAIVVDDNLDGVTVVTRGRDLLESTARQIVVSQALKFPLPSYMHIPLVCDHDGRRLAKRQRDLGLCDLRKAGVKPQEIVTWASRCLGQESATFRKETAAYTDSFNVKKIPQADILLPRDTLATFQ